MNGATSYLGRVNVFHCYSEGDGIPKAALQKRQQRLLERARPLIERVLEPGEELWYAAEATSPFSLLEFFTTGWIISILKRCLLVFTDRRILHLPADRSWRPKRSIAQVRYADLAALNVGGVLGRRVKLVYREGKSESFSLLRRQAFTRLRALLATLPARSDSTPAGGRGFLCPRCSSTLTAGESRCAPCGLAFRDRRRATWWSIVVPGGGYFYTGHPVLGVLDALVETLLILFVALGLFVAVSGEPDTWPGVLMIAAVLVAEKLVTIYHARHYVAEFLPAES